MIKLTNTELLNDAIDKSGLKREWIAEQLGITRAALFEKINNKREFKASEVAKLAKILSFSNTKTAKIFLTI